MVLKNGKKFFNCIEPRTVGRGELDVKWFYNFFREFHFVNRGIIHDYNGVSGLEQGLESSPQFHQKQCEFLTADWLLEHLIAQNSELGNGTNTAEICPAIRGLDNGGFSSESPAVERCLA